MFKGTFGTLPYYLTTLFQSAHGFSALRTGMASMVPAVSVFVSPQIGERITTKVTLVVGFLVGGARHGPDCHRHLGQRRLLH